MTLPQTSRLQIMSIIDFFCQPIFIIFLYICICLKAKKLMKTKSFTKYPTVCNFTEKLNDVHVTKKKKMVCVTRYGFVINFGVELSYLTVYFFCLSTVTKEKLIFYTDDNDNNNNGNFHPK